MKYGQDYAISARRHLKAAQSLHEHVSAGSQPGCRAVAGYLFGVVGELAVKQMMRTSGMRELPTNERSNDPFYKHFPQLRTMLLNAAQGRRAGELRQIAEDPRLFQNWDTDMRYAPTIEIKGEWVNTWKASAENLVAKMEF